MTSVSVVIPTYNCGWCIATALGSVLAQTFDDYEVIVVDDGSTDDTRERIGAFADPRIRYLYQPNAGRSAARNTGINESRGAYVAFLDADDLWLPAKLAAQVELLRRHPNAVMAYGPAYEFRERDKSDGTASGITSGPIRGSGLPGAGDRLCEFLLQKLTVFLPTVMARRETLVEIGGFDTRYTTAEDLDLYIRLALAGSVAYDPSPQAAIWRHFDSYLSWMRKYGGHHALVSVIENTLGTVNLMDREPGLAAQARCGAEWSAALIDIDLGDMACAARHVEACLARDPEYPYGDRAAASAAERVFDTLGRDAAPAPFARRLRLLTYMSLPPWYRGTLYGHAMAYYYVQQAFVEYGKCHAWRGLAKAIRAACWNWRMIGNKGIWKIPFAMFWRSAPSPKS